MLMQRSALGPQDDATGRMRNAGASVATDAKGQTR